MNKKISDIKGLPAIRAEDNGKFLSADSGEAVWKTLQVSGGALCVTFSRETDEDPICEYSFLGRLAFGFEFPTEDGLACNFLCAAIGQGEEQECNLLTVLTTGRTYEEIDDLLDLIEEKLTLE